VGLARSFRYHTPSVGVSPHSAGGAVGHDLTAARAWLDCRLGQAQ
jgi:hypothetical protein